MSFFRRTKSRTAAQFLDKIGRGDETAETSGTNLDLPPCSGARRAAGEANSGRTLWRAEAWRPAAWIQGGEGPGQENHKSIEDGEE
jgi:hypothetical protein